MMLTQGEADLIAAKLDDFCPIMVATTTRMSAFGYPSLCHLGVGVLVD